MNKVLGVFNISLVVVLNHHNNLFISGIAKPSSRTGK